MNNQLEIIWTKAVVAWLEFYPRICLVDGGTHSCVQAWLYKHLLGPGLFFCFVIFFIQALGHLGRVISPSQGRYLQAGHHKHRINAHTDIHDFSWIRAHDPSFWEREDSPCFRQSGHTEEYKEHFQYRQLTLWPRFEAGTSQIDQMREFISAYDISFIRQVSDQ
jgi:hypothetical protein